MSKQKYYAVVGKQSKNVDSTVNGQVMIYDKKSKASEWQDYYDIIPIPAEELNSLIKKYRKK